MLTFTLDGQYVYTGDEIYRVYEPTANVDPDWWREYLDAGVIFSQVNLATTPRLQFLTHPVDYSPIADYLKGLIGIGTWVPSANVTMSDFQIGELASRLASVDGLPWLGSNTDAIGTRLSAYQPWVVYNGPTANCKKEKCLSVKVPIEQVRVLDTIDHTYDCVTIIQIGGNYDSNNSAYSNKACTRSALILHYNLPKD